ncbi:MAG: hypothetical protein V3U15_00615 [Nitrospinota bacterium]
MGYRPDAANKNCAKKTQFYKFAVQIERIFADKKFFISVNYPIGILSKKLFLANHPEADAGRGVHLFVRPSNKNTDTLSFNSSISFLREDLSSHIFFNFLWSRL